MQQLLITRTLQLIGGIALWCWVPITVAKAQIAPDGTLSTNVNTSDGLNFTIDNGNRAGNNLFHSFREFSVPTGGSAFFNNALDVQNIFSRVTGGNISNIDGSIKANGVANLFLINPSGIIFGPNARLNIGGSFLASTANSLLFDGGIEFSATNTSAAPLLAINIPIGLQFRGITGEIRLQQSKLQQFQPGRTLAFVGGNTTLEGGNLVAAGGRVELGGLAATGTIGLNVDGNLLQLNFPDSVTRSDVSITNKASIDVRPGSSGSIAINAQNLNIFGESRLVAGISSGLGGVGVRGGDITLNATGAVSIGQSSSIRNDLEAKATGQSGNIIITAGSLSLTDKAFITNGTSGQGNAGNVTINVRDNVSLTGDNVSIFGSAALGSVGDAGNINIEANSLSLSNGARLATDTFGNGNAGNVIIDVRDRVSLAGDGTTIFSTVASGAIGNGGEITIKAKSISLTDGAYLIGRTFGQGNAGSVSVQAEDSVSLENSFVLNDVQAEAIGKGGNISIQSGSLSLSDGAELVTSTLGQGDAGSVTIKASGIVSFDGVSKSGLTTGVFSTVEAGAKGKGGDISIQSGELSLSNGATLSTTTAGQGNSGSIEIQAQQLLLSNGSQMLTATSGQGDAGNISVQADDLISLIGSSTGISSSINPGGIGKGGNINIKTNITTGSLLVSNEAVINASTYGEGDAGSINVTTGSLSLTDKAQLFTSTFGQGNAGNVIIDAENTATFSGLNTAIGSTVESGAVGKGGNITLTARSLSVTNGAALTASTYGEGNAGDVTIQVDDAIFLDGTGGDQLTNPSGASSVVNSGAIGKGGNVTVTTGSLSMTNGAVLLATTFGNGNAGNVNVQANNEVYLDNSVINSLVTFGAVGNGGDIRITARSLSLANGARLSSSTFGQGSAGSIFVQAEGSVLLSGNSTAIFSTVEAGAVGKGGDINITGGGLSLTNGAQLQTQVRETSGMIPGGRGNAGNVTIEVLDAVTLIGKIDGIDSAIISDLGFGSVGNSGDVTIIAKSVLLSDGGRISTSTFGQGNAGRVLVQAQDSVSLNNGNIFSTLEFGAVGRGGDISITANDLVLTEGSEISSSTFGQGNAGNVLIQSQNSVLLTNSGIGSVVQPDAVGNGGEIKVQSDLFSLTNSLLSSSTSGGGDSGNIILENRRLVLRDGAAIAAATFSGGKGGTLSVTASDSIELIGTTADGQSSSGLTTQSEADGAAGNLIISTGRLILQDRAEIAVAAKGKGAAGNLEVTADSIRLNNGTMTGETAAGDRGNITLQSQDVQLRRTSSITTNAQGIATGGNITIDTGILAALENSDIRANAQQGSGGQVRINAQGIFGSVSRTREDLQTLLNTNDPNLLDPSLLPTSDITAISQQGGPQSQGSVQLITPDVDPSSGLIELPQTIVDPDALIAQNPCTLGKGSEFTVTGRGGLPPNPSEALSSRTVRVSLIEPTQPSTTGSNTAMTVRSPRPDSLPIVPAQGWILNEKGQLVFTAYDPTGTGSNRLGRNPPTCPAR